MDSADNTFTIVEYNNHQITMRLICTFDIPEKIDRTNRIIHHSKVVRERSRRHHRRHNDQ